jgi:hypothetical protein
MTGSASVRERMINKFYLTGNYRLRGGKLQADWYYLPMQKLENILSNTSSLIFLPVISSR